MCSAQWHILLFYVLCVQLSQYAHRIELQKQQQQIIEAYTQIQVWLACFISMIMYYNLLIRYPVSWLPSQLSLHVKHTNSCFEIQAAIEQSEGESKDSQDMSEEATQRKQQEKVKLQAQLVELQQQLGLLTNSLNELKMNF